jgi:hypothetical protein
MVIPQFRAELIHGEEFTFGGNGAASFPLAIGCVAYRPRYGRSSSLNVLLKGILAALQNPSCIQE